MDVQTAYQKTIIFATLKHLENNQTIGDSNLPYVIHLSNVAMEILIASNHTADFDLYYATQVALLHDTLEDTNTTFEELEREFGIEVAEGVSALTKNDHLPKEEKMLDSLNRISKQRKEVWAIKLADRITNLQKPPKSWDNLKRINYVINNFIKIKSLPANTSFYNKNIRFKM